MRKPISVLSWVVLAVALVVLPTPARAAWGYSAVDVFGTTVVGTSTTYLDSWEFYEGYHPYVEGTLSREWQTLGSNEQFSEYDSFVSVQVYATLEPGNAMYYMDGVHEAGMDVWDLYYVGSTYCGYYYFDPAAWPPYIYGISPNVGVSGTSGYIPIYGAYLAPQGTTPQVLLDGTPLWIAYQSDNQINVYYDYVSLGTHWLSVTTIYGTSNYVQFTALAGDATPSVASVSPDHWDAGTTTDFSIAGTGFGTNPGLTITGGWIEDYGVYSAWDTGMNAWVRVASDAPNETVTVSVTSNGYWGNSFMEQYPNQPRSGSKNAQVNAAPAGCGDVRDQIIQEYVTYGVNLTPQCSWFTQTARSEFFQFSELKQDNPYSWALIRQPLTVDKSSGYGLDRWRQLWGASRISNSGYRSPYHNAHLDPPGAPQSQHMWGDAIDLRNETRTEEEYNAMASKADRNSQQPNASADYVEPIGGPCGLGCVHADWRNTSGPYSQ